MLLLCKNIVNGREEKKYMQTNNNNERALKIQSVNKNNN